MKNYHLLLSLLGNTDIYLIDQILKNRFGITDKILDAGCGGGRNMHWFIQNKMAIYGIDNNETYIAQMQLENPLLPPDRLIVATVENMPFPENYFDHIISSAVLHFAINTHHFLMMIADMMRVLKPNGSLFIRMTSDIGIENKLLEIKDGVYNIPDGTSRFLLTRHLLSKIMIQHNLKFIEPLKTVNVDDVRCMSTLMVQKTK